MIETLGNARPTDYIIQDFAHRAQNGKIGQNITCSV